MSKDVTFRGKETCIKKKAKEKNGIDNDGIRSSTSNVDIEVKHESKNNQKMSKETEPQTNSLVEEEKLHQVNQTHVNFQKT